MYYRIAMHVTGASTWRWKSSALGSLPIMLQWLLYFHAFPRERLRVFFASSCEALDQQLWRANEGLASASVPATRFVPGRRTTPQSCTREMSAPYPRGASDSTRGQWTRALLASNHTPVPAGSLDQQLDAQEHDVDGDHDLPYHFSALTPMPQILAWVRLLARAQCGDLRYEVAAVLGVGSVPVDRESS